jgi:hypothetical protein
MLRLTVIKKVWWMCAECKHEWQTSVYSRNIGRGCPICKESKGENQITKYLNFNNINFIPQMTYDGLVGVRNGDLSYDFYIPNYNLLIEYQGEFHDDTAYKKKAQSLKEFETQIEHDKRKRDYAINNNIKLLEIWYYDFDNIENILTKELIL